MPDKKEQVQQRMSNDRVGQLFDLVGSVFDNNDPIFDSHYEQMGNLCQACFSASEVAGSQVLDAGCGTGTATAYFARHGAAQVDGIDLSHGSLAVAAKMTARFGLSNTRFHQGSLLPLPFREERFDIIFSCGVLPYVGDVYGALEELLRVTRPGGKLAFLFLKKTSLDGLYDLARMLLCRLPGSWHKGLARLLAALARPLVGLVLRRDSERQGKPLEQTLLEAFFSPVKLNKQQPDEVIAFFASRGGTARILPAVTNVDFFSSDTGFIVKVEKHG